LVEAGEGKGSSTTSLLCLFPNGKQNTLKKKKKGKKSASFALGARGEKIANSVGQRKKKRGGGHARKRGFTIKKKRWSKKKGHRRDRAIRGGRNRSLLGRKRAGRKGGKKRPASVLFGRGEREGGDGQNAVSPPGRKKKKGEKKSSRKKGRNLLSPKRTYIELHVCKKGRNRNTREKGEGGRVSNSRNR